MTKGGILGVKNLQALAIIGAAAVALGTAGCGNGGIRIDAPSGLVGATGTTSATIPSTGGTVPAPGTAISGYFVLPASTQNNPITLTIVATLSPPAQLAHATLPGCGQTAIYYTVTPNIPVVLSGPVSFDLAVSPTQNYAAAFFDPGATSSTCQTPVVGSNPAIEQVTDTSPTVSISPSAPLIIVLYGNFSSSAPTIGTVVLSPSSLAFSGTSTPQTVTATQSGFAGPFTASAPTCAGIATVATASANTFTVTPLAGGQCTATVTGTGGATATLLIGVTTLSITGS